MIRVELGELWRADAAGLVRPVSADFSPVTAAMRRFDEAAGTAVAAQCGRLGELPLGSAVITAAGELAAEIIVHVAVRSAVEPPTAGVVRQGLINALRRVRDWGVESVAIAPLGTGAGNLDAEEAAAIMIPLLVEHTAETGVPSRVTVVVDDEYQHGAFRGALAHHAGD